MPAQSSASPSHLLPRLRDALARRDLDAIVPLAWELYYEEMYVSLVHAGASDPDDVIQNTFARLVQEWAHFDGDRFAGWLFTLLRYEMLTLRRRAMRERARSASPADEFAARLDVEGSVAHAELCAILEDMESRLDAVGRVVLEGLREGLTDAEVLARIAARTGQAMSEGALHQRRFRLRSRLAEHLRARGYA